MITGLNCTKEPVGIDAIIDKVQRQLFFELTKMGWTGYESYHRAYRNKDGKDTVPEVYTKNGNYVSVLFNDKLSASTFFLPDKKREFDIKKTTITQNVAFIVQANLDKLFPNKDESTRGDELLIDNVRTAFLKIARFNTIQEIVTGVDEVYGDLKISYTDQYLTDLGNFTVARFNLKFIYSNTNPVHEISY